jgi:hypothetical protein
MKKIMLKSALLVLTLLVQPSSALLAQETPRPNNVRNAGAFLCSDFLPVVRQPGRQVENTTAASRSNGMIDMFPIGDTWELLRTISLVCTEDETQIFEKALQVTLNRMRPFWVRQNSGVTSLSDPSGRTVQFYTEAVRALQEALNRFGANISVDGINTLKVIPPYSSGRRTSVLRPVVTGTDRLLCHTVAE